MKCVINKLLILACEYKISRLKRDEIDNCIMSYVFSAP